MDAEGGETMRSARTQGLILFVALTALGAPGRAQADDPAPPSQALASDHATSHSAIAVTVDPVAAIFGAYGPRFGFTLGDYQALWASPSFQRRFGRRGAGLELTYEIRPMGRGLEGVHIGLSLEAAYFPGAAPIRTLRAGLEVGYSHVWGRVFLGASAGACRNQAWAAQSVDQHPWGPLVRAQIGYAFL
jgi:hypothetical protein